MFKPRTICLKLAVFDHRTKFKIEVNFSPQMTSRLYTNSWRQSFKRDFLRAVEIALEHLLTLARTGGGCNPLPLRLFADSEKTAARSAAGIWATLWGKPCAIFGKKNWPGQVRSRSYDVIRGTTSGNFSNKVVSSRNLTWRHWCKW